MKLEDGEDYDFVPRRRGGWLQAVGLILVCMGLLVLLCTLL